jgi:hypothetical protein
MASLTLPALALALSNPGAVRLRAAAFRCWALRRRGWAAAGALASPNSVLSEHAFKRLQLGSDDEDGEGPYGSDADEGFEAGEGDNEELAIARLGLPDELVATLEKRGITHLFPIQVNEPLRSLSLSLSLDLLGSFACNCAAKRATSNRIGCREEIGKGRAGVQFGELGYCF